MMDYQAIRRCVVPIMSLLWLVACQASYSDLTGAASASPTETRAPTPLPTLTFTPTRGLESPNAEINTVYPSATIASVERFNLEIVGVYPHDTHAYTEGLVYYNGLLYESTGSYPDGTSSTLREVRPETGDVLRTFVLKPQFWGEGLALFNGQLVQITWQQSTAFLYDLPAFYIEGAKRSFFYDGEGWGLCFDGAYFFMSDGTSAITIRDPETFSPTSAIEVRMEVAPVQEINELECVGDELYANVWHTENILRIDKHTGQVTGVIDASGLLTPAEATPAGPEGWLNGIAYNPDKETFYITGKMWPKLFEVKFVPSEP